MQIFITSFAGGATDEEPAVSRFNALRDATGQAEFIVTGAQPGIRPRAEALAKLYKCEAFVDYRAEACAPGEEAALLKAVNKLIGKERVLLFLDAQSCGRAIAAMTGAPHAALSPGSLALVRFKGFIIPAQGVLQWVKEF